MFLVVTSQTSQKFQPVKEPTSVYKQSSVTSSMGSPSDLGQSKTSVRGHKLFQPDILDIDNNKTLPVLRTSGVSVIQDSLPSFSLEIIQQAASYDKSILAKHLAGS